MSLCGATYQAIVKLGDEPRSRFLHVKLIILYDMQAKAVLADEGCPPEHTLSEVVSMLLLQHHYTEPNLSSCLAQRFPSIPIEQRQPLITAVTSAAQYVSSLHFIIESHEHSSVPSEVQSVSNARHLLSKWNSGLQREEQSVCDPARFGSSFTPELSSTQNVNVTDFVSARHLLEMSFVQTQNPESFSSDYEYSQQQSLSPVKSSISPVHSAVRPSPELNTVMQSQENIRHSPSIPNSQQSLFESDEVIPDSCNASQHVECGTIPNVELSQQSAAVPKRKRSRSHSGSRSRSTSPTDRVNVDLSVQEYTKFLKYCAGHDK